MNFSICAINDFANCSIILKLISKIKNPKCEFVGLIKPVAV